MIVPVHLTLGPVRAKLRKGRRMNSPSQVELLLRQVRNLRRFCIALAVLFAATLLVAATGMTRFDVLSVERLNIVDAQGKPRLVLANAERFPPPTLGGKTFKRAVQPAGIVFFNAKGDEVGGLALTDFEQGRVSALAFDYANADAMGLMTRITPDGKEATTGLQINSRPDEALEPLTALREQQIRVQLHNRNEVAELVLSDRKGRPRLRLAVGHDDKPTIEMLDEAGKPVYSVSR
jgi:hypothetical protein